MTQYSTEPSNGKQLHYAIRVQLQDSATLVIPWESFDREEREAELQRIDKLIEAGCRFVRIGEDRFPVDRIIIYQGFDYIPFGTHFNSSPYYGDDND